MSLLPSVSQELNHALIKVGQLLAIAAMAIVSASCILAGELFRAAGDSMEPGYPDGTTFLIKRVNPSDLKRGDLVVFAFPLNPERSFFKRLIGLPGEEIELKSGLVYVDGVLLDEPYVINPWDGQRTFHLGPDEYFVLGDNRSHSSDSQNWGPVSAEQIIGIAVPLR